MTYNRPPIPSCFGCDKPGYYGICLECMLPETEWEPHNRSVPTKSHNNFNYTDSVFKNIQENMRSRDYDSIDPEKFTK